MIGSGFRRLGTLELTPTSVWIVLLESVQELTIEALEEFQSREAATARLESWISSLDGDF